MLGHKSDHDTKDQAPAATPQRHAGGAPASTVELKTDIKDIRDDLSAIKSDAAELADHTKDAAIQGIKSIRESAGELHTSACAGVRTRPVTSILLAASAGVILGRLLGSK